MNDVGGNNDDKLPVRALDDISNIIRFDNVVNKVGIRPDNKITCQILIKKQNKD